MDIKNIDFLFSENPNPMWIYDPSDLSIKRANDSACDLYGYSEDELLSMTIMGLRPQSEHAKLKQHLSNPTKKFNNAGIWKHHKKNGDIIYVRVLSTPITHEEKTYKLITVQDVTNEIHYQQEQDLLFENSLDGIMLTSPDGSIYRANEAACDILGMTEEEIIQLGREGLVEKDEKLEKALKKREKLGEFSGELTFIHKSGRRIPVELTTSVYTNPQGEPRTSIIFRDITERKQTEQKLRDILEHSTNMFYRHDTDHIVTYLSPQAESLLGCKPEEAKLRWTEFATDHPVNNEGYKLTQKAIDTGQAQSPYPLELEKTTGEKIWVRVNEAPVVEHGKTTAIVGSLTDITEQRQYEERLQESLERYHYVTKATSDAIYDWDIVNDQHHLGEGFNNIFGHDTVRESFPLVEYTKFVHPDDHPGALKSLNNTLKDPSLNQWSREYRLKASDGEFVNVIENAHIIRNEEGVAVRMIGAIQDVSKQRKLEQLLDQAYAMGRIGVWELNLEKNELYWSKITKDLHEVKPDFQPDLEMAINFYKEGKSRKIIQEAAKKAIDKGTPWDEELQIVTAKGNERWVRSKGEPEIVDGECRRLYGIFQDVHERKVAQTKMIEALEERQRILERITQAFFAINKEWTVTYWNNQAEKVIGLSHTKVLGNNLWELFPEAKKQDFFHQFKKAIEQQIFITFEEYYPPLKAWFEVQTYPSSDGLSVFFRDITESKNAKIKLANSEERLRLATEQADIAVWEYDFNTNSMSRSSNHDRLYGIEWQDKWDINTFLNATHTEDREYSHAFILNSIAPGGPDNYCFDFRVIYPNGSIHWLSVTGRVIERDESGQGIIVRGTLVDITEQKQKEKQLQESLAEKETLLQEIHHRVKNNMAVVSGMMQLQAFEEKDAVLKQKLNSSIGRIKTMGSIHELLYQSESFSRLEAHKNIEKLITEIASTFQTNVELDLRFDLQEISLNINQAIPFSLIINEVVTNVLKHAFEEQKQGMLSVTLSEEGNFITFQATDNGKGLPPDFTKFESSNSLGIQLIETLSSQLWADYSYQAVEGGTQFTLTFKKADVKGTGNSLLP
ncbi:MAG: PAS domain S-box protein [Candidatus Halalkalibacterium sp. M3_1C_030]